MKIGVIGLGKMGGGIAERLVNGGMDVIGFDFSLQACTEASHFGCIIAESIEQLAHDSSIIWLLVPAGKPVDDLLDTLLPKVARGTIIIDAGNSHFPDSIARATRCAQKDVYFLDCGTSGGLAGRELGYCLMVGGDIMAYQEALAALRIVACKDGVAHVGPSGAGHYVKMIHNGIEYGVIQAYAEGFHLLKEGSFSQAPLDLEKIANLWRHGALLRSWFLDLTYEVLKKDQTLTKLSGEIFESGTGQWTVDEAHTHDIPVPVIEKALTIRAWSRTTGGNYATKLVALIRNAFGGHTFTKK